MPIPPLGSINSTRSLTTSLGASKELISSFLVCSANSSNRYSYASPKISSFSKSELRSLGELKWEINFRYLSSGCFLLSLYFVLVRTPSKSGFSLSIILHTWSVFSPIFFAAVERTDHLASSGTKK
jgi:hypothetical protein